MQITIMIVAFLSFVCFGMWMRIRTADNYPFLRKIAYVSGPTHLILLIIFYVIFVFTYGLLFSIFGIICYSIFSLNIVFLYSMWKKNRNIRILDLIYKLPDITDLVLLTIAPNAFLVCVLAGMQMSRNFN